MERLTDKILGCAVNVSKGLGTGFLDKVYENALALELGTSGLEYRQQISISVHYGSAEVGHYVADLVIENRVILELKTAREIDRTHEAQLLNYLRATGFEKGLILDFGTTRLGIKRLIQTRGCHEPSLPTSSTRSRQRSVAYLECQGKGVLCLP